MRYHFYFLIIISIVGLLLNSCTSIHKTIREPESHVEFYKDDFVFSDQLTAEATTSKVFGIDFSRLVLKKSGKIGDGLPRTSFLVRIPVIGNFFNIRDKTINYALYELMQQNPGYDVVFYPQYDVKIVKPILGIGLLNKVTTVKVTARLGKIGK